jgi:hypothetical protein
MRLDHLAMAAIDHLLGRLLRRALLAILIAALMVTAIFHVTVAATLALETQYGALHAQLIVGAIYAALALIAFAVLWGMRAKSANASTPALAGQRELQMAMLVEAVMLGYALARKGERAP